MFLSWIRCRNNSGMRIPLLFQLGEGQRLFLVSSTKFSHFWELKSVTGEVSPTLTPLCLHPAPQDPPGERGCLKCGTCHIPLPCRWLWVALGKLLWLARAQFQIPVVLGAVIFGKQLCPAAGKSTASSVIRAALG